MGYRLEETVLVGHARSAHITSFKCPGSLMEKKTASEISRLKFRGHKCVLSFCYPETKTSREEDTVKRKGVMLALVVLCVLGLLAAVGSGERAKKTRNLEGYLKSMMPVIDETEKLAATWDELRR